jgi:hypothetical protein
VKWYGKYGREATTCLSSILSISYHYSTYFSSLFCISFRNFLPDFP